MTSIITVLNKVYKEGLEPLGFQKIKSKHPYFVRVVAGEIIQVISYRKKPGRVDLEVDGVRHDHPELGRFQLLVGIATVYRRAIDLSVKPMDNNSWLKTDRLMYVRGNRGELDMDFCNSLDAYTYRLDSVESMQETAGYSFDVVKKIILPIFDEVTDLESCVKYMERYSPAGMTMSDDKRYGWDDVHFGYNDRNESMLYIKTNNRDDYKELIMRACQEEYELCTSDRNGLTIDDYKLRCVEAEEIFAKRRQVRDRILDTPEIYKNAVAEMERRKARNVEVLRSYGLDL